MCVLKGDIFDVTHVVADVYTGDQLVFSKMVFMQQQIPLPFAVKWDDT
jgi:hypothetical protein